MTYWWDYWNHRICIWQNGGQRCMSPGALWF